MRTCLLLGIALPLLAPAGAIAVDQPIGATKLILKKSPTREKFVFVSRDPAFLFPGIGGADDPTLAGAVVELFSKSEGVASFSAGSTAGDPGWSSKTGGVASYRFRNKPAPAGGSELKVLAVKQGRVIKIRGPVVGLPLTSTHESIGIRITFGSQRSCALFDGTAVRKDQVGLFAGKQSAAAALADCDDDTLRALVCGDTAFPACAGPCPAGMSCGSQDATTCECLPDPIPCSTTSFPQCDGECPAGSVCTSQDLLTCTCVAETDPCGSTFPVCNGECPIGEECMDTGGSPVSTCGCIPTGQPACSTNTCGGVCPAGQECNYHESPQFVGCVCGPPGPCGSGGDDCPVGFFCGFLPPGPSQCYPRLCSGGSYPTCGGSCGPGEACMPFGLVGTFLGCICAPPGLSCESTCSAGMECPPGEACLSDPGAGGACGCAPF